MSPPVVLIGLDAAEITLVDRLCAEGELPALQSLRERGCSGTLHSNARLFGGAVWPTFYASRHVPWTGIYHNKQWRPERMRCEIVTDTWLPERPFWRRLEAGRYRVAILDVPSVLGPPGPVNGVELAGWGSHDLVSRGSWPPSLWEELERTHGGTRMTLEMFGGQSGASLLRLRDHLLDATRQMARIGESALAREPWDLFLIVFGATHRGGHYLWDLSQIGDGTSAPGEREALSRALVDVYRACDRAVARLVGAAPADARVMAFAVHGMGTNLGWSDRCPEILERVQRARNGSPARPGLLYRLRSALPWPLLRQVTTRLPSRLTARLVELWSARMFAWETTPWFPLPMDLAGYIRVNLKGREREGIVAPGAEYDSLCRELADVLLSFRDAATGERIVDEVHLLDELAPMHAPYRELLPDLVVTWRDAPATHVREIRSPTHGSVRWAAPS
ncbi:MAG: alkaline phosphatase family protein, partial [Gemmatimonadetes bacterium]|nr:alkaline phosphatase family protein [Gemmatimonadota bacterium]